MYLTDVRVVCVKIVRTAKLSVSFVVDVALHAVVPNTPLNHGKWSSTITTETHVACVHRARKQHQKKYGAADAVG